MPIRLPLHSLFPLTIWFCFSIGAGRSGVQEAKEADWTQRPLKFQAQKASLTETIKRLHPLLGHSLLVQGDSLTQQADINVDGTIRDVLDRVADAYDYRWSESKSGVILMRKRFHNPQEHPQTSVAEMRQMAQDAVRLLRQLPFNLDGSRDRTIDQRLTRTFTETQVQTLSQGTRLPLREMPPEQHDLIQEYVFYTHFTRANDTWNTYLSRLEGLRAGYLYTYGLTGKIPENVALSAQRWLTYAVPGHADDGTTLMLDLETPAPKAQP